MIEPPKSPRRTIAPARVTAVNGDGEAAERPDRVAAEEPMEIQARGPGQETASVAVTMRTPGNDFELAAGFLFTEGLISGLEDIESVRYCDTDVPEQQYNVVTVRLTRPFDGGSLQRNFYATSSCGVCGKASIDQVEVASDPLGTGPVVDRAAIHGMPGLLRAAQKVFDETGGIHAAGLFDSAGQLLSLREDVGRHNALDKVIGNALLAGRLPLSECLVQVSGRVSFELVQKAAVAGVPVIAAVGAPSSLAIDAGERLGMTVIGFVRDDRFNVYSHPERIAAG